MVGIARKVLLIIDKPIVATPFNCPEGIAGIIVVIIKHVSAANRGTEQGRAGVLLSQRSVGDGNGAAHGHLSRPRASSTGTRRVSAAGQCSVMSHSLKRRSCQGEVALTLIRIASILWNACCKEGSSGEAQSFTCRWSKAQPCQVYLSAHLPEHVANLLSSALATEVIAAH
jgi:hypothetical protein